MPRPLYGMGRRGLLPARLASLSGRFETPWFAIAVYGMVVAFLAAIGTFRSLATLLVAAESIVLVAMGAALAAMWRRNTGGIASEMGPGWAAIIIVALAFLLWLLAQVPPSAALPTLGILVAGGIVDRLARRTGGDVEPVFLHMIQDAD